MNDDIYILGITMTKFGKHPDKDTVDLGAGNDRLVIDWREASFTNDAFMTLGGTAAGYRCRRRQ